MNTENQRIGLALSGGGYRAAVYHLGTLKKLHDLGVLEKVDVISTVSGGSITGAYYALHAMNFERFEREFRAAIGRNTIKAVLQTPYFLGLAAIVLAVLSGLIFLLFTAWAWVSFVLGIAFLVLLLTFQFKLLPVSKLLERVYDRFFFENKTLSALPDRPLMAINSTNMETGRLFTFSKNKMADSTYEYPKDGKEPILFHPRRFPIARAVAASACVPFAFTPVTIDADFYQHRKDMKRAQPRLVDGGVYDNQGIHKLTQAKSEYECDWIFVSDAGNMMPFKNQYGNTVSLLIRTCDAFMNRIKNFQTIQHLFQISEPNGKIVAYQSLGWNLDKSIPEFVSNLLNGYISPKVWQAHGIKEEDIRPENRQALQDQLALQVGYDRIAQNGPNATEIAIARAVSTNLTTLTQAQTASLIKQSSAMTELHVKLYLPMLLP